MSRTERDQPGGHRPSKPKWWGALDCRCCENIPPARIDPQNRARREREAATEESTAND